MGAAVWVHVWSTPTLRRDLKWGTFRATFTAFTHPAGSMADESKKTSSWGGDGVEGYKVIQALSPARHTFLLASADV